MQARLRLLHDWGRQVRALLPAARATRAATLALFALGVPWAGNVALLKVAAALPLPAVDPSTERRLRRWLANPAVAVDGLWRPLLPGLLAGVSGREVVLVFDPTPFRDRLTVLCLGIVQHKRVLPLAWRAVPQRAPWPAPRRPTPTASGAASTSSAARSGRRRGSIACSSPCTWRCGGASSSGCGRSAPGSGAASTGPTGAS